MPKTHSKERIVRVWGLKKPEDERGIAYKESDGQVEVYRTYEDACAAIRRIQDKVIVIPITISLPAPRRPARKATKKK